MTIGRRRSAHMAGLSALLLVAMSAPALADAPTGSATSISTPSSTPTATTAPSPSVVVAPSPPPSQQSTSPAPTPVVKKPLPAAHPRLAPAGLVASVEQSVITADSMTVSGFQYTGLTTLPRGGSTVVALTFVMSTASMPGFALTVPCHPVANGFQMQFVLAVPGTAAASSPASMTVYATEIDYTTTDTSIPPPAVPPYRWTVAAPPPLHLLAADAGTLTGVKIVVVRVDAPTMTFGPVKSTSSFC